MSLWGSKALELAAAGLPHSYADAQRALAIGSVRIVNGARIVNSRPPPLTYHDEEPTWDGKTFAQLRPVDRAALKREDAALYERMRNAPTPKTYDEMSWSERAMCKQADPALYERMRAGGPEAAALRWDVPSQYGAPLR